MSQSGDKINFFTIVRFHLFRWLYLLTITFFMASGIMGLIMPHKKIYIEGGEGMTSTEFWSGPVMLKVGVYVVSLVVLAIAIWGYKKMPLSSDKQIVVILTILLSLLFLIS